MDVYFYTFQKRPNSTALPGDGVRCEVQLKAPTNIIGPEIALAIPNGNPTSYNYCNIPDFGRMYFIRNWTYNIGGIWVASLSEDVLASWKEQIGQTTQYVVRSSSESDGSIVDTLYPTKAGLSVQKVTASNPYNSDVNTGNFVLSTVCSGYTGFGATTFWRLSSQAFDEFRTNMLSSADYLDIDSTEISTDLTKALFNPYQYCISCMWFPLTLPTGTPSMEIAFGWWKVPISSSANCVTSGLDTMYIYRTFQVPKHPQASARGMYLNIAPYSRYTLYFPPFGEIALDGNKIGNASTIFCKVLIDVYTGTGYLFVSTDDPGDNLTGMASNIISMQSAQIGVPVSLAQLSYNTVDSLGEIVQVGINSIYGAVNGLMQTGGKVVDAVGQALKGDFKGAVDSLSDVGSSVATNVGDAAQSSLAEVQYKGNTGAVSIYNTAPYLIARFFSLVDDDNDDRGRPLCQKRRIDSLPGYILVADADVALPATQAELDAIRGYMESGFFYE